MKSSINIRLGLLTLGLLLAAGAQAQSSISGVTSRPNERELIQVGPSTVNGGPHHAGAPGIGVQSTVASQLVDFAGLSSYAPADAHGVTTLAFESPTPPPGAPPSHDRLGSFHFAKVSNADVYYGEWSQTASASDGTHTSYYVGDHAGTTVPATGTATYAVQGISDYANRGALAGSFAADFGARQLTGSLSNGNYAVDIGTATIKDAAFIGNQGSATVAGATVASQGAVSGSFFGANAAALAGIVAFDQAHQHDTAFGGSRQ